MPKKHKPREGSLQVWPRKRAAKILPSVNWKPLEKRHDKGVLGFICYKCGMVRVLVRDLTPNSQTKNKQIILPLTVLECPPVKVLAIRLYKDNRVFRDILAEDLDHELKRKLKLPKVKGKGKIQEALGEVEKNPDEFDRIHLIVYSIVKKAKLKKTPDIAEMGIGGSLKEQLQFVKEFVKENLGKEVGIDKVFSAGQLIDVHGVTKGFGFQGPVKRFGMGLRDHKSEKGRRRPGSIGPWRPARVSFRVPMAGQHGFFTRLVYNLKIIDLGDKEKLKDFEFKKYGKVNSVYLLVKGSIQGPAKRQVIVTMPLRQTKRKAKENFEVIRLLR